MKQENYNTKVYIPEGLTCKSPYVYGIRFKLTSQLYIGSKYEKRTCDSSIFMTDSGYITSSKYIIEYIEKYGLDAFEILFIRHFETSQEAIDYEK